MKSEQLTIIKEALRQVLLKEDELTNKELSDADAPSAEFYERLDKRAAEIAANEKRSLSLRRAIAVIIAAALILAALTISVSAVRDKVKGFVIELFDGFAILTVEDPEIDDTDPNNVTIGYITENFTQTWYKINQNSLFVEWKYDDEIILINCTDANNNDRFVDTEGNDFKIIDIDGTTVHYTNEHRQITLGWTDGKMMYGITCTTGIEWEEMIKIFKSIKYEEKE